MCTSSTAKRRRRQLKQDKRYRKHDPTKQDRRNQALKEKSQRTKNVTNS